MSNFFIYFLNKMQHGEYAQNVKDQLMKLGFRAEVDFRNEKLGYKIREAQTQKVPYTLVLGDDELQHNSVNVRKYGSEDQESKALSEFVSESVSYTHLTLPTKA